MLSSSSLSDNLQRCCSVLIICLLTNKVVAGKGGQFDLRIVEFTNPTGVTYDGTCCFGTKQLNNSCSEICPILFRICLSALSDSGNKCHLGESTTSVIGSNDFIPSASADLISIPFDGIWQGSVAIMVEALTESATSQDNEEINNGENRRLVLRSIVAGNLNARTSDDWNVTRVAEQHGIGIKFKYRVRCSADYYGEQCTTKCVARDDEMGHYTCDRESGQKVCMKGWIGAYCMKAVCSEGCAHGSCRNAPLTCTCDHGWIGANCSQCLPLPGCVNGYCSAKENECRCHEGWGGQLCDIDLDFCGRNSPCLNGGICHNTIDATSRPYSCDCPTGLFHGTNCELAVRRSCSSNECVNGGRCGNDGVCICPDRWTGEFCEREKSPFCDAASCLNGGTCVQLSGHYYCSCRRGFGGESCQINEDDCGDDQQVTTCLNGGRCVDGDNDFSCVCKRGYIGKLCGQKIDICANVTCLNGGFCKSMQGGGFRCECVAGFGGALCEANLNECESMQQPVCQNGGTCLDGVNRFTCLCHTGFIGRLCQKRIDNDCGSQPCMNGGRCGFNIDELECDCPVEFYGDRCEFAYRTTSEPIHLVNHGEITNTQLALILLFCLAFPLLLLAICAFFCYCRLRARMRKRDQIVANFMRIESGGLNSNKSEWHSGNLNTDESSTRRLNAVKVDNIASISEKSDKNNNWEKEQPPDDYSPQIKAACDRVVFDLIPSNCRNVEEDSATLTTICSSSTPSPPQSDRRDFDLIFTEV